MTGLIKYPKRIKQLIDFTGVQNKKIHPSDIDAVLEFDSKYLLLFEFKFKGAKVPIGQRLMLERIIDSWEDSGKIGTVVYCEHTFPADQNIMAKECQVVGGYNKSQYKPYRCDFLHFIFKFGDKYDIKKIIA
tara:strand:+ start:301 stop:696 length:396 start_codon:yes stop_codon:yes gene_type:complete